MKPKSIQSDISEKTFTGKSRGEILTEEASDYIEAHSRKKFSLQKMAGELFVNGSYLLRVFKKHTGYTPLAYHNHIRCEEAKIMLLHSDERISEIGEAVGFVSPAHFSHVFKRTEGCTPTEYRTGSQGQSCRSESIFTSDEDV